MPPILNEFDIELATNTNLLAIAMQTARVTSTLSLHAPFLLSTRTTESSRGLAITTHPWV